MKTVYNKHKWVVVSEMNDGCRLKTWLDLERRLNGKSINELVSNSISINNIQIILHGNFRIIIFTRYRVISCNIVYIFE